MRLTILDLMVSSSSGSMRKPNSDAVVYRRAMAAPVGLPERTARQIEPQTWSPKRWVTVFVTRPLYYAYIGL